jgi:hypothetical protein
MWFASALLSGEQTVVSTGYGSTKSWQSAFVTLSSTLATVSKASFWACYSSLQLRADRQSH